MSDKLSILLVGIGGYGGTYVDELLDSNERSFEIKGVVDPYAKNNTRYNELLDKGIPFFNEISEFYNANKADLAVISSPIQFHAPQTIAALKAGTHVLCEKPLSASVKEALYMIKARNEANRIMAVGYQWSFSKAILDLKKDIQEGLYGKPKRLKTMVLWPRSYEYFNRNNWAGRIKDDKGNWILDSVVNNATAHYLHNMFFVLGEGPGLSARPQRIAAELYRANKIENYDTAFIRIYTTEGTELLYYASHALKDDYTPDFIYEFEKGTVFFGQNTGSIVTAQFDNGKTKDYGNPYDNEGYKLWCTLEAIREGKNVPCPPEAALSHTVCVNGMQDKVPITDFPDHLIIEDDLSDNDKGVYVKGLENTMRECFGHNNLPGEIGIPWAKRREEFDLSGYYKGE